jgi:hypothetical protein
VAVVEPLAGAQRGCAIIRTHLETPPVQLDLMHPIGAVRRVLDQLAQGERDELGE